jgi:acetyl esterase
VSATLHPEAQAMLERIVASGERPMEQMTAQEARAIADARVLRSTFPRRDGVEVEDRIIHGSIPLRIYRPQARSGTRPLLVYFHGGGMVVGSIETVDPHCRVFALELDCVVVSVGYRLAPEHKFPAAAEDGVAAATWIQDHAAELRADPARMALAGESSGGTLVALVCHALRDAGRVMPRIQVMVYPVLDSSTDWESFRRFEDGYFLTKKKWQWFCDHYLRSARDLLDPRASPIRAQRFDRLPPALIVTAGFDPLMDSAKAYADKLRAAGGEVDYRCFEQWPHGFFYWADSSAGRESMALCIAAIRAHLAASSPMRLE